MIVLWTVPLLLISRTPPVLEVTIWFFRSNQSRISLPQCIRVYWALYGRDSLVGGIYSYNVSTFSLMFPQFSGDQRENK